MISTCPRWLSVRVLVCLALAGSVLCGSASPALAQADAAISAAEGWLLAQQRLDGSFGDPLGMAPRDTASTVLALAGRASAEPGLTRGIVYLEGSSQANADFHARRALALAAGERQPTLLLAELLGFENGGGLGAFRAYHSNLLDTALAVEALALDEGGYLLELAALLDYLQLHQHPDGGWGFVAEHDQNTSDLYFTAGILSALVTPDQLVVGQAVVDAAAGFLASLQQADGGFGDPLSSAVVYRALLTAGQGADDLPFGSPVDGLLTAQRPDGSWDGDIFTTAEVVRALRRHRADLDIVAMAADPATVSVGSPLTLSVTVRNRGALAAPATRLAVHRDSDDGPLLAEIDVAALSPGAQVTVSTPIDTNGIDGVFLDLVAFADSDGILDEADEDDNRGLLRIDLASVADWAIFGADFDTVPAVPSPDTPFDLVAPIRNLGESPLPATAWQLVRTVAGVDQEILASGTAGPLDGGASTTLVIPLSFPEGEHALTLRVDPDDQVTEAREDNNQGSRMLSVVDPERADLTFDPASWLVDPTDPQPGDLVTVSVDVLNLGARDALATLDLVALGSAGPVATPIASEPVSVIAGGRASVSTTFTLGAEIHSLEAVADPDDAVPELDESNNRDRRVLRPLADLVVGLDNLEIVPAEPLAGETVTVRVTVRNAGFLDATAVDLVVYDGAPGAGAPIFEQQLPTIPVAGNQGVDFTWTARQGASALVVAIDPADTVPELSEDNNQTRRELAVPRTSGPNLELTAVDRTDLVEDAVTRRVSGEVVATLANTGDAPAVAPFLVELFEDRDGDRHRGDTEPVLASALVETDLAVGASAAVSLALDATTAFHHSLAWIVADADDTVAEQREDDNRAALGVVCETPPPAGSLDPTLEWSLGGIEVETAPTVIQLTDDNGDGRIDSRDTPDVVFLGEDAIGRGVFARDGLDGSEHWTFRSSAAHPLPLPIGHLAAADLDGDGIAEVIVPRRDGRLMALDHRGEPLWVGDVVEGMGERWAGGIAVGDLDGDGAPELAVGRAVLSRQGRLVALGTANRGRNYNQYGPLGVPLVPGATDYPHSLIADLDLDGRNELIAGDAVYRLSGGQLLVAWDHDEPGQLMVDGFSAVAQLDTDPQAEVVVVSSNAVLVLEHDGVVARARRTLVPLLPLGRNGYWGGPPTVADLDGDGQAEIVVAGETEVVAFRADLSTFWRAPFDDVAAITGVAVFDLDGDGFREVLTLDNRTFSILDGGDGSTLFSLPNTSKTASELPVVADVDGDGRAEILLPSNVGFDGDASTQGLRVLGNTSWQATRPIWNQHTYRPGHIQLDGTVPSRPLASFGVAGGNGFRTNPESPTPPGSRPNATLSWPRTGRAGADGLPVVLRLGNGGLGALPRGTLVELHAEDPVLGGAPVAAVTLTDGLRPGAWTDVELLWTAAAPAGTVAWARAVVPPGVEDCQTDDDRLSFPLDLELLPDLGLAPGGFAVPATVAEGQRVPVTLAVRNRGTATASTNLARLVLGDPASGPVAAEATIPVLEPGAEAVVELSWETSGLAPGSYALYALVDAAETVTESNEGDNLALATVVVGAGDLPDPSLEALTVAATATAGDVVPVSVTIRNRGADLTDGLVVALQLDGAEVARSTDPALLPAGDSRQVSFDLETLGRLGLLSLAVVVDPDGVVAELDEGNNSALGELEVLPSPLWVSVTPDRIAVRTGESVTLDLAIGQTGTVPVDAQLEVRVLDALGVAVATLDSTTLTLPPGTTPRSTVWTVGDSFPGVYTILAELHLGGVLRARGVAGVSIAADLAATAQVVADRDGYGAGEIATLTIALRNEGVNTVLAGTRTELTIVDTAFVELFRHERDMPDLVPGGGQTFQVPWPVGSTAPGRLTARLVLRDVQGLALAGSEVALTIDDSADDAQGLHGSLGIEPAELGVGAPLAAGFTLSHQGNADLTDLGLRLDLLRLPTTQVVASTGRTLDLPQGQTLEGTELLGTAGLAPGTYLLELVASPPAGDVRLDTAVVRLERGVRIADAVVDEGDTGTALLRFDVSLDPAASEPVQVGLTTVDGTAVAGEDYQAVGTTLTFAPGETRKTFEVVVLGDLIAEADEVVQLVAEALDGGGEPIRLADGLALGTIRDEEGCAGPELLAEAGFEDSVEGLDPAWSLGGGPWRRGFDGAPEGRALFSSPAAGELAQEVDLGSYAMAVDAGEVELVASGLVWGDGSAQAHLALEMLAGDGTVLASEGTPVATASVSWRALGVARTAPAGTRRARLRLVHDGPEATTVHFDRASLRVLGLQGLFVDDLDVLEGDGSGHQARVRIALACAAESLVSVDWATADSGLGSGAQAGADYVATTGIAHFAPGESEAEVMIDLVGDTLDELDETFAIVLSDPAGTAPPLLDATARVTILDDDGMSEIVVAPAQTTEGPGATLDFVVALSSAAGRTITVSYATVAESAAAGADFDSLAGTLVFAPGETTRTVAVPLVDDGFAEGSETLRLELSAPTGALLATPSAVGRIDDDEVAELSIDHPVVLEGHDSVVFTLRLSAASTRPVEVTVTTADGEALAGSDYTATSTRVTLPVGARWATVAVPLIDDGDAEPRETFRMVLSDPLAATLALPEGTATVVDDDGLLLTPVGGILREWDTDRVVHFAVELSQPSSETVTVEVATADGTATEAEDYLATAASLVFPPGTTRVEVPVTVLGDDLAEDAESFDLVLDKAVGAELGLERAAMHILDDDRWALVNHARPKSEPGCFNVVGGDFVQREHGAVWNRQPLDLTEHFDKTFQMRFGAKELTGGGVVFALQNQGLDALGGCCEHLGYNGISPSVGIEFDHWNPDHVAIDFNGSRSHAGHPAVPVAGGLGDGQEHQVRVVWNSETRNLALSYDGQSMLSMERDLVSTIFGGESSVTWGFTGSYGNVGDRFSVCVLDDCAEEGGETTVSIGGARIVEGDAGTVRAYLPLTLACPQETPVTVSVATADGTALVVEDYGFAAETKVFAPGETSKTILVELVPDDLPEPDEVFYVDITSVDGAQVRHGRAEVTILSDEITAELRPAALAEGDGTRRTWTTGLYLDAPLSQATTLQYQTVDGTALAGSDYVAKSGTLALAAGQSSIALPLEILGDTAPENEEVFYLDIVAPPGSVVESRRIVITLGDDDACAGPNLLENPSFEIFLDDSYFPGWVEAIGDDWRPEGSAPTHHGTYYARPGTLSFGELRQDVDVSSFAQRIDDQRQPFAFEGWLQVREEWPRDLARIVVEYRDVTNTQILDRFDTGDRASFDWTWITDLRTAPVGTRWIRVRLLGTRNNGNTNDARFDDFLLRAVDTPAISIADVVVSEGEAGQSQAVFPISLSCPSDGSVRVDYLTSEGSATAGEDYQPTLGTLVFPNGASSATITVPIFGDTTTEGDESFWLDLVNPRGAALARSRAQGTIVEDEIRLSVDDKVVDESEGQATFTLSLDRPAGVVVRVEAATADLDALAGEDYAAVATTVEIPAGEISTEVVVPILDDLVSEPALECFRLLLSNAVNATFDDAEGQGCIRDDDRSLSISDAVVPEGLVGETEAVFTVTLSRARAQTVSAAWATADDTAEAGVDYLAASGSVSFAPGQTEAEVRVVVLGDAEIELTELFTLTLSNPVGATLLDPEATGFIVDDDDCQGPSLLVNGGGEEGLDGEPPAGWQVALGGWTRFVHGAVLPRQGLRYLAPGALADPASEAELYQDIDVADFAPWIDSGRQRFLFEGWLHSVPAAQPDLGRVVIEFLSATGTLLDVWQSPEVASTDHWQSVVDLRATPVGTRILRLRLLARHGDGAAGSGELGVYFDALSLRSAGVPVVWVSDPSPSVEEGDLAATDLLLEVSLSCTDGGPVSIDYSTREGGGPEDQLATSGLDFAATTTTHVFAEGHRGVVQLPIQILADGDREPIEYFTAELSNPVGAVLRRPTALASIVDDDSPLDTRGFVTLQTAAGDGQVTMDLGAYGDWGYDLLPGSPVVPAGRGEAYFDPPGVAGPSETTFAAALLLRRGGHPQTFLTTGTLIGHTSSELPNPGFVEIGPRHAVSTFLVDGLHVELRQSLHDVEVGGQRVGGVLVQRYELTNRIASTAEIDLIRYFDGDIDFGSASDRSDGGGRRIVGGREMIFQTDVPTTPEEVTSFVGITSELGELPATARWEVADFESQIYKLRDGGLPGNFVAGDFNGDGMVDANQGEDLSLMLRSRVETLAPGQTVTYQTYTFFGQAVVDDYNFDLPPTADAGGQRTGVEGQVLTLDASASADAEGPIVAYDWDLDGDGLYGEPGDDASGATIDVLLEQDGGFVVGLRVTDSAGNTDFDTAQVVVGNLPPQVTIGIPNEPGESFVLVELGEPFDPIATFTDPGVLDSHTASTDWGDGPVQTVAVDPQGAGMGKIVASHVYASEGFHTVTVCVTDEAGDGACDSVEVFVELGGETTECEPVAFDAAGELGPEWTLDLLGDAMEGDASIVEVPGEAARLHLSGTGTSLYHSGDNGAFYHRAISAAADFRIEVDVTDFPVDTGGEVRKVALMLRTGLDPWAPRVMVTFVPHLPGANPGDPSQPALQFDARLATGATGVEIGNTYFGAVLGSRLAIEKRGDVVTVYHSQDGGLTWQRPNDATYGGSAVLDWSVAGETLYAGVMVASYDAAIPFTAELADFTLCRPDGDPAYDPPAPPLCDPDRPTDAIVLLDVSGSMTAPFPGAADKLEAAQAAIGALSDTLSAAGDGSRMALVTYAGHPDDPARNLAEAWTVLSPLTGDVAVVDALVQALDASTIDTGTPTATALAIDALVDDLIASFDPDHQPVVIWLSDGVANIDLAGRGPSPYELEELQAISLRHADGSFRPWGAVGWSGDFNPTLGTFDGEPLANAMFELERLDRRAPETLVYGLALEGDGSGLGTSQSDLLAYGAHISGGLSFASPDLSALLAAISAVVTDLDCGGQGTAVLAGRIWHDREPDGSESADTSPTGEPGLAGVSVGLYDGGGLGITSATTGESGTFTFGDLPAGAYSVQVDAATLPLGEGGLPIDVPTYDADGIATLDTASVTLAAGELRSDVDFGYRERDPAPPAELCVADGFGGPGLDPAWQLAQLGDADQGTAAVVVGELHLAADGTSLFHGVDNGGFVYRSESGGDFRLEARITGVPDNVGGPVRKGCLVVRSGLGASDARVMACYIPNLPDAGTTGLQFDVRHADGTAEEMATVVLNATLPVNLAIESQGGVVTVEYRYGNQAIWTRPGGLLDGSVTLDFGANPLAGLMVASYDADITTTVAFDDVTICRPNPELP